MTVNKAFASFGVGILLGIHIFNGNNYSEEWRKEAEKRGLDCETSAPLVLDRYLDAQPWLNRDMTHMVRHLQSSDTGVPLQVYAFTNTTVWVEYERIQASLFEHIMAIAPLFDLKIFQRPSGGDLEKRVSVEDIIAAADES